MSGSVSSSNNPFSIIKGSEQLLQNLAEFKTKGVSEKDFKIVKNGHVYSMHIPSKETPSLLQRIKNIFLSIIFPHKVSKANDFVYLKEMFEEIEKEVREQKPELAKDKVALVADALHGLENLYRAYADDTSAEAMIKRNDILEARSVAYRKDLNNLNVTLNLEGDEKIKRIAYQPLTEVKSTFSKYSIALVAYKDMKEAVQKLNEYAKTKQKDIKELNIHEVQEALGPLLKQEKVPMGALLDLMYSHGFLNFEFVKKLATKYSGKKYEKEDRHGYVTPEAIAKFFKKLTISIETIHKDELYAFSEMFTTDLREQKSPDAAFQRALKPEAIAILTEDARKLQDEIHDTIGTGNLVTNCAFDRFGLIEIPKNGAAKLFNITGKCFARTEGNIEEAQKEKSYSGRFAFSLKQALGFSNTLETTFKEDEVVNKNLTPDKAARSMLRCVVNMFDRHKAMMVVQRLAPADIHHFASTVQGKILTWSESCEVLQKMLEKQTQKESPEYKQLQELLAYFQNHDELNAKTIDIKGTQGSVSRKALFDHSVILALNNRRIRMVKHNDGSVSIDCFVGATGVDRVNINERSPSGEHDIGEDYGSMGFGEMDKTDWLKGLATKEKSIKLNPAEQQQQGSAAGKFHQTGSTVISIYLSKDLMPIPALEDFSKHVKFAIKKENLKIRVWNCFAQSSIGKWMRLKPIEPLVINRAIEVQGDWGQVIALPTAYVAFNALKKVISAEEFDKIIDSDKSPKDILQNIAKKLYKSFEGKFSTMHVCPPDMEEQEFRIAQQIYDAILKKDQEPSTLTEEQRDIYDKINEALQHYISQQVLKKTP